MTQKNHQLFKTAWLLIGILFFFLGLHAQFSSTPYLGSLIAMVIIFIEIIAPLEVIKFFGLKPADFNIYAHKIENIFDVLNVFEHFRMF